MNQTLGLRLGGTVLGEPLLAAATARVLQKRGSFGGTAILCCDGRCKNLNAFLRESQVAVVCSARTMWAISGQSHGRHFTQCVGKAFALAKVLWIANSCDLTQKSGKLGKQGRYGGISKNKLTFKNEAATLNVLSISSF